ncbi:twin-arginine translocation signal domain-containing protein, partial [Candidatus Saccharibacteria bacterium]|nr:twin-arginine translocation signal domain-containing protein [candidate division Zixibacteria bacterium]NIT04225.1 twin-arginine translocation signal domain-containing protein [Candidatus Saccharibacteria bacterium]
MEKRKKQKRSGGRTISRRKFLGVAAGATAALSLGTYIRSGLGA